MPQFRKKPVVIEAYQINPDDPTPPPDWLRVAVDTGVARPDGTTSLYIQTLEGVMRADYGDWIIKGVKGELYPCKADIFAATYEAVA